MKLRKHNAPRPDRNAAHCSAPDNGHDHASDAHNLAPDNGHDHVRDAHNLAPDNGHDHASDARRPTSNNGHDHSHAAAHSLTSNSEGDAAVRHDETRREFLRTGVGALAGITLAPGVLLYEIASAREPHQAATAQNRWGMLVDVNRCADGCDACVTACNDEHGLTSLGRPKTDAQWIRKLTVRNAETGYEKSFPVMCQHCESPPCVDVCPTGASFRREDGIVLVDKHTCIGCRYCMIACPYKARSFIHEALDNQLPHAPRGKGTVESCTLCVHKVDRGDGTTACAEACAREGHHALLFGDLNDPDSEISKRLARYGGTQIRADLKLNTGVRYQGI